MIKIDKIIATIKSKILTSTAAVAEDNMQPWNDGQGGTGSGGMAKEGRPGRDERGWMAWAMGDGQCESGGIPIGDRSLVFFSVWLCAYAVLPTAVVSTYSACGLV